MSQVLIHQPKFLLADDTGIRDLSSMTDVLLNINESNFEESWKKIEYLGYISKEKYESLIRMTILVSAAKFTHLEPFFNILVKLSKIFDVKKYVDNFINSKLNRIELMLYKMLLEHGLASEIEHACFDSEYDMKLQLAIMNDDIEAFQHFSADPSFSFTCGVRYPRRLMITPQFPRDYGLLPFICMCGAVKCFKFALINLQKHPEYKIIINDCPYFAVYGGNVEIIRILEQNSIKYCASDSTAAIATFNVELTEWLFEKYSDESKEIINDFISFIIDTNFAQMLLKINSFGIENYLKAICKSNFYELIEFIVKKTHYYSNKFIIYGIGYGSENTLKLLCEAYPEEVKQQAGDLYSILTYMKKFDFIEYLLSMGCDPNKIYNVYPNTHRFFEHNRNLINAAIEQDQKVFFNHLMNIDSIDVNSLNPLMKCIVNKKFDLFEVLMNRKDININATDIIRGDISGYSSDFLDNVVIKSGPLLAAMLFKKKEVVEKLLRIEEVDINATGLISGDESVKKTKTFPLLHALKTGDEDVFNLLLNRKDINVNQIGWVSFIFHEVFL